MTHSLLQTFHEPSMRSRSPLRFFGWGKLGSARLTGFQRALRAGGLGLERFAFGPDMGEFLGDPENFPVAVLQNKELLDDFLHLN